MTATALTGLLYTVLGLVICFAGHRLFRLYLMIIGFIIGFNLVIQLNGSGLDANNLPVLIVAVIAGIVVALLAWVLYRFGVAITGGFLGYAVGTTLIQSFALAGIAATAALIVCILIGVVLAFAISDLIIVVGTSIIGAQIATTGLGLIFPTIVTGPFILLCTLILAVIGFAVQWQTGGRRRALA